MGSIRFQNAEIFLFLEHFLLFYPKMIFQILSKSVSFIK